MDRIPGHPASVDALVAMTDDVIATGSEDGMIRVMQILPNKFRMFGPSLSVDDADDCSGCDCDTRRISNRTNEVGQTAKVAWQCQS